MVHPITGPFDRTTGTNVNGLGSYKDYQRKWKQGKPYNLSLPYLRQWNLVYLYKDGGTGINGTDNVWNGRSPSGLYADLDSTKVGLERLFALNRARSKFIAALGERVELGVDFAERRQSLDMIAKRGGQLLRAISALRRGDVKGLFGALRSSGHTIPRKRLTSRQRSLIRSKKYGDLWLEFWFGWSPLVQDIYGAIEVLEAPVPLGRIKVSSSHSFFDNYVFSGPFTTDTSVKACTVRAVVGGSVSLSNSDLYLASRLGLTNPATWAWELIPFSFLVDWFVNVGEFLSSMTDTMGLSITEPYSTLITRVNCDYSGYYILNRSSKRRCELGVRVERTPGFPSVALRPRLPSGISPTRAATAISLLLQQGLRKVRL